MTGDLCISQYCDMRIELLFIKWNMMFRKRMSELSCQLFQIVILFQSCPKQITKTADMSAKSQLKGFKRGNLSIDSST